MVESKAICTKGSFDYENTLRNEFLSKKLNVEPSFQKTGTTICGVIFNGGVVLGCDTRATAGPVVAVKNCIKIEPLAKNIACAGAGTSADCSNMRRMMQSKLELLSLATGEEARVLAAKTMLQQKLFYYGGYISAYLIVGGADATGSHLFDIYANGAVTKVPFIANGSGSLAATSVLESGFKDSMTELEAIELVCNAIKAGIYNDLGSGSNVDIHIITREGTKKLRNYCRLDAKAYNFRAPPIKIGSTETYGQTKVLSGEA